MKVRSVANGNVIDLPDGHGLIAAGIYVPVEEQEAKKPRGRPRKAGEETPAVVESAPAPAEEADVLFTPSPALVESVEKPAAKRSSKAQAMKGKKPSTKVEPMGVDNTPALDAKRHTRRK